MMDDPDGGHGDQTCPRMYMQKGILEDRQEDETHRTERAALSGTGNMALWRWRCLFRFLSY